MPCAPYVEIHPCFNLGAGAATLGAALPAHQPGPVRIELLGLGHAASVPFTLTATPQAPRVIASYWQKVLTVTWNRGGQGTSPITGWTVTPYRDGVKQTPIQVAAGQAKAVIPGVKAGEKYVITVTGTNASGTGDAGSQRRGGRLLRPRRDELVEPVVGGDRGEPGGAVLRRALLGVVVDVDQAEPGRLVP